MNAPEIDEEALEAIAIVGMAGRFPGAKNIDEFWKNLSDGVESITFFTPEELIASGIDPELANHPHYVRARGILEGVEDFDSPFFGFNPREAEMTDVQHRIFLECAWEALEHSGCDPDRYEGVIGVFGGAGMNTYFLNNVYPSIDSQAGMALVYQATLNNDKDALATLTAYKLNLRGPAVGIQTACSTSLVAVHMACQSLINGECDIALAGGVSIHTPQKSGYLYEEGMILSPDGHCRVFDAKALGTVSSNGCGIVVLKRFEDAVADRDFIYALIRGSAINNDGSMKVGYTAPGMEGQRNVVISAQAIAGVSPDTITYVEAHGTGTSLGDPVEIAALTQAFRAGGQKKGHCAIGSVKANIGHLDTAAGVTGLIKTALALKHKMIPPSPNFEQPNPQIDFNASPFYVNTKLLPWETSGEAPRRAGVSSFGIGGTNAHVILEEAPDDHTLFGADHSSVAKSFQLLTLSAKTAMTRDMAVENLIEHLKCHPELDMRDVAHTLQMGRKELDFRGIIVCRNSTLSGELDIKCFLPNHRAPTRRSVVFMFSGQGSQYVNMAREIYETEPIFHRHVDECSEILVSHLGFDLRNVLYPKTTDADPLSSPLHQTAVAQPALFVLEYALAKLWMEWGVRPSAMIGHSIGEYTAACLAGVFSLEEGLSLVAARGQMMQKMPLGEMLMVLLSEKDVLPLIGEDLSLAAVNGASLCVVSGRAEAVESLQVRLSRLGVESRRLHTSHAFHSNMMDPIMEPFAEEVSKIRLNPPQIPFISNVTGTWIQPEEATNPYYWQVHLRRTVRFADGLRVLLQDPEQILIEVGPGRTLSTFAMQHSDRKAVTLVLNSVRHPKEKESDTAFLLTTLGKLWLDGVKPDWLKFHSGEIRRRIPLPTYPFRRKRCWIESQDAKGAGKKEKKRSDSSLKKDIADWFYVPSWKRAPLTRTSPISNGPKGSPWLIFNDGCGLGFRLIERLRQEGEKVIVVGVGRKFAQLNDCEYTLNPEQNSDYDALMGALRTSDEAPKQIVHLWNVTKETENDFQTLDLGFYSLLFLAQAIGRQGVTDEIRIAVLSNGLHEVTGEEIIVPEKATLLGPVRIVSKEYPNIRCCSIDVTLSDEERLPEQLLAEFTTQFADPIIALRGVYRWIQNFEPVRYNKLSDEESPSVKEGGVWLITGGLGGVGFVLAEHLAKHFKSSLVLTGRSPLPDREKWDRWLADHGEKDPVSRKILKAKSLESHGVQVLIVSADVTNKQQIQALIAQSKERLGNISGVIHAAGIPGGGVIQLKTREMAENVLAPKIKGARILYEALKDCPPDFFILFSSLTSIIGELGQVDYCAANAFLDAFAHYGSRNGIPTVSLNWDAWQEVGMAAEASKTLKPISELPMEELGLPTLKPIHPIFDYRIVESPGREMYITHFRVNRHWVLDEHRIMGKAVLPATAYLEMALAAFENHKLASPHLQPERFENEPEDEVTEIKDIYYFDLLVVEDDEEVEARTILEDRGDYCEFSVISHSTSEDNQWKEHARGKIYRVKAGPPRQYDVEEIRRICNEERPVLEKSEHQLKGQHLRFGIRWNSMKELRTGAREGLTFLELPETLVGDLEFYKLHPAMLDTAGGFLTFLDGEELLPFCYKRVRIRKPAPQRLYGYTRYVEGSASSGNVFKVNSTIMDENGTEVIEMEEYTEVYSGEGTLAHKKLSGKDKKASSSDTRRIPANLWERLLKNAIAPSEGAEAFHRVLGMNKKTVSRCPQIVISTCDLHTRTEQEPTELIAAVKGTILPVTHHQRPALGNIYVAPRNEIEQKIADTWQEHLGISEVGIHDNFFELGGNSLLATQIISRLRDALHTEIAMDSLFDRPTVASLAEAILLTKG